MKAMLLAAGRGERFRPLTDKCPKPLIPVNGKPLIEHQILKLKAAGITDIIVNCAWLSSQIIEFIDDGRPWQINIAISQEQQGALETAGGIIQALDFFDESPFWVVSSDIFSDIDFSQVPSLSEGKLAHLFLVNNPEHHPNGDFFIDEIGGLHSTGPYLHTFASMGLYTKELFAGLEPGKRALGPLLREAMVKKQIQGSIFEGLWVDVGTQQRLSALEHTLNARTRR